MGASYKKRLSAGFQPGCQCGIEATQFPQWPRRTFQRRRAIC
ncbi:hypothetical protein GWL_38990 [Herbaspirillum sp. GW103]|nr:hypothetical protein GWL_38990 [Herbaspirillum sp. GW103]